MEKVKIFFITYAWLIFVIFTVLLLLSISNVTEPRSICKLEKSLSCKNVIYTDKGLSFEIINEQESQITLNSIKIIGDNIDCSTIQTSINARSTKLVDLICSIDHSKETFAVVQLTENNGNIIKGFLKTR